MSDHEPSAGSQLTIAHLHERSYSQYADRTAVITSAGAITYRELGERVHRIASGLAAHGLARGDRAVILLDNCEEYFEIDQALFVGGFVRVALSTRLHPREVRHVLEDCGAHALFTTRAVAAALTEHIGDLETLKLVVAIDGDAMTLAEVAAAGTSLPPLELPTPREPAALLYTSGTTGAPKGATLSHANWLAMVRNSMAELPPVRQHDVVLHVAPLSHLSGYVAPTYFVRGAAHLTVGRFEADDVLDRINAHHVTLLPLVPTILNLLTLAAEARTDVYPSLASIVYAGSPIAPDRLRRARKVFGDVFTQFYGLSETPMPLTCLSAEDHRFDDEAEPPARLSSAGRPSPFVEVAVLDAEGHEMPIGEVGEIVVRGDTTMVGYWNRPEATAQMIGPDGWARTGDLGRFDDEGYLYIVDRIKDMVVSGGFNVYPTEVEGAIATLPAVEEVAVIGVPDDRWGEAVMAFVVVRDGHTLTEGEVIDACASHLAGYKKPRAVEFVPQLPKTGSGKLKKRELRAAFWSDGRRVGG
jgi:acyl-CoA synthetase (AMP-forming)/AMP-acid ligase II